MKKYFAAGVAILLPIAITLLIARFFLHLLTKPFLGVTQQIVTFIAGPEHFLQQFPGLLKLLSEIAILAFLFGFILFIGAIGKQFLANTLFYLTDRFLHTIPIANKIYKAVQDVLEGLFSPSKPCFSQVVLAPFPNTKSKVIGFITREGLPVQTGLEEADLISVFIPGTPNPTMGFMLLFSRDKLIFTDLNVEDAVKFQVSCGVVLEKNRKAYEEELKTNYNLSKSLG